MQVCVVGVNHSTTPIAIREKLSISKERLQDTLLSLHNYLSHGVILSTCNRTEVYTLVNPDTSSAELTLINLLKTHGNLTEAELIPHIYVYKHEMAIRHLFKVVAGLDSMLIGEFEILGQVRQALEEAERAQMINLPLRTLFQHAIRTGRRVRKETAISRNALSVSSVAVELAARVISNIRNSRVLVIGAGEAGRLAAKALVERGVTRIRVTSRSQQAASSLALTLGGSPTTLSNLGKELSDADIVITCTGAPHFVVRRRIVEEGMNGRPERPLVLLDIAVPRDIEPEVGQIKNVFLYDIDDLTGISELNRQGRESDVQWAMEIVEAEVGQFISWWQTLEVKPVISALVEKAEDIRQHQLNLTIKKMNHLTEEEQNYMDAMSRAIVAKILHHPIECLKKNGSKGISVTENAERGNKGYIQVVRELFALDEEDSE